MARTVFFSWQSDTPRNIGRGFLEPILKEICAEIASDTTLEEAQRDVQFDSDTQGVPGTPPIFQTILEKIDSCGVFVGDLTFVGERMDGNGPTPNPNVLVEHGYALRAVGYKRVVNVMNSNYGKPTPTNLPFDLRHTLAPMTFNLTESVKDDEITTERARFYPILRDAVKASLGVAPTVAVSSKPFPEQSPKNGASRFRANGERIGLRFAISWLQDTGERVFLTPGPAMWLRVMPTIDMGKRLSFEERKAAIQKNEFVDLVPRSGGRNFVRSSDGVGAYYANGERRPEGRKNTVIAGNLVYIFDTGEIWSVETYYLQHFKDSIPFAEQFYANALDCYARVLDSMGLPGPYQWIAGMTGIEDRKLLYGPPPKGKNWFQDGGDVCVSNEVVEKGIYSIGERPIDALKPFFIKLHEECGMTRPSHYDSL